MRPTWFAGVAALVIGVGLVGAAQTAGTYPVTLTLDAQAGGDVTTVTSSVTVAVKRLMEESRRKRVTDALTYSGYGSFLTALRPLPPVGTVTVNRRSVEIRYAREQQQGAERRLVLIADRPLFFLSGDAAKPRTGYELTVVELRFDAQGVVTGTMAGAARVKPSPDGPVLDDFAETPVRLSAHAPKP
jgi:PKD repeat protein